MELVGEAADGLEAIQTVRTMKPDLLLMDIRMPERSGLEVIASVATKKSGCDHPLLQRRGGALCRGCDATRRQCIRVEVLRMDELLAAIHAVRDGLPYEDPHFRP